MSLVARTSLTCTREAAALALYSPTASKQCIRRVPSPAPGLEDTKGTERQAPPVRSCRLQGKPTKEWTNHLITQHRSPAVPDAGDKWYQVSGLVALPCQWADREWTRHIITSKSDKRMKKTGQRNRLTLADKVPTSLNNFRMWTLEQELPGFDFWFCLYLAANPWVHYLKLSPICKVGIKPFGVTVKIQAKWKQRGI